MASRIARKSLLSRCFRAPLRHSAQGSSSARIRSSVEAYLCGAAGTFLAYWILGLAGVLAVMAIAAIWAILRSQALAAESKSLARQRAQSSDVDESPASEDRQIPTIGRSCTDSIKRIDRQNDPLFRQLAELQLSAIDRQMDYMAEGRIIFTDTESWRTAYEQILATPGLGHYYSAAWLRSEDYWRDAPGRHSMRLNYDLVQLGLRIERTLILNDFFWPEGATLPAKTICRWIEEQYKRGLVMRLVRESELEDETDLVADSGIYGTRATGTLELDDRCRSLRYTLDFSEVAVRAAEDRWRRLQLFSHPFRELLDRTLRGG